MPEVWKLVEAFVLGMLGALAVDLGVNNTVERIHRGHRRWMVKMGTLGRALGGGIVALAVVGQDIPAGLFAAACLVLGATGGAALLSAANRRKVEETKRLSLEQISRLNDQIASVWQQRHDADSGSAPNIVTKGGVSYCLLSEDQLKELTESAKSAVEEIKAS